LNDCNKWNMRTVRNADPQKKGNMIRGRRSVNTYQ
jgi:hypothetical protein